MNRKIKLIWDFYGDKAQKTAEHHLTHLLEFFEKNKLTILDSGVSSNADFHRLAFVTVEESLVKTIRDVLKPNRAFVVA